MFHLEIKTKGLKEFRTLYRNFEKMNITLSKKVREKMANIVIQELRNELVKSKKIATKHLYEDIYSREVNPNETRVYFGKTRSAYGVFVDLGSKNISPPNPNSKKIGYSIKDWINMRGIKPIAMYPGAKYPRKKPPTMEQLAYAIAGGMAEKRRKTKYITRKALSKADSRIRKEIDREVSRVMDIYGF